jgi:hypothetical protein
MTKAVIIHSTNVVRSDIMIIVLAIGPKVRRFIPGKDNEFIRVIKIRITTSFAFGGEVKLSFPCCKILRHVKYPRCKKRDTLRKNHGHFSPTFSLLRY